MKYEYWMEKVAGRHQLFRILIKSDSIVSPMVAAHEGIHERVFAETADGNLHRILFSIHKSPNRLPHIDYELIKRSLRKCWQTSSDGHEIAATYLGLKYIDSKSAKSELHALGDYTKYYKMFADLFDRYLHSTFLQFIFGWALTHIAFGSKTLQRFANRLAPSMTEPQVSTRMNLVIKAAAKIGIETILDEILQAAPKICESHGVQMWNFQNDAEWLSMIERGSKPCAQQMEIKAFHTVISAACKESGLEYLSEQDRAIAIDNIIKKIGDSILRYGGPIKMNVSSRHIQSSCRYKTYQLSPESFLHDHMCIDNISAKQCSPFDKQTADRLLSLMDKIKTFHFFTAESARSSVPLDWNLIFWDKDSGANAYDMRLNYQYAQKWMRFCLDKHKKGESFTRIDTLLLPISVYASNEIKPVNFQLNSNLWTETGGLVIYIESNLGSFIQSLFDKEAKFNWFLTAVGSKQISIDIQQFLSRKKAGLFVLGFRLSELKEDRTWFLRCLNSQSFVAYTEDMIKATKLGFCRRLDYEKIPFDLIEKVLGLIMTYWKQY